MHAHPWPNVWSDTQSTSARAHGKSIHSPIYAILLFIFTCQYGDVREHIKRLTWIDESGGTLTSRSKRSWRRMGVCIRYRLPAIESHIKETQKRHDRYSINNSILHNFPRDIELAIAIIRQVLLIRQCESTDTLALLSTCCVTKLAGLQAKTYGCKTGIPKHMNLEGRTIPR